MLQYVLLDKIEVTVNDPLVVMTMPILTFDIDEMYHVPYICYIDTHIDKSWRPSCTFG